MTDETEDGAEATETPEDVADLQDLEDADDADDADDASDADAADRRSGDDRRDPEERRKYREGDGRRDATTDGRRVDDSERRRQMWPFLLAAFVIAGVVFFRSVAVAPARAAREQAETASAIADPILRALRLPMQALPGFSPPVAGDPTTSPAPAPDDRQTLENLAKKLDLAAAAAPGEPAVYVIAAPIRVALGDEREARLAWEQVLVHGTGEEQEVARLGIATLTLRVALRTEDEQDRRFGLESALRELSFVKETSPFWSYRLFSEVVGGHAIGDADRADSALLELSALSSPVAKAGTPLLREVISGAAPLLPSGSGGEARSRDTEPPAGARPARDADAHDQE